MGNNNFETFNIFLRKYCELYQNKDLFKDVDCKDSYKAYYFNYYAKLLHQKGNELSYRQINWYRRLQPILDLPAGSTIIDFGGGYGMDTIFLASCGYKLIFLEQTENHIAICKHLQELWEEDYGFLDIQAVLSDQLSIESHGKVDAIFLDEVAHHIEPVTDLFEKCYAMIKDNGHLFLLEPNYYNPLVQFFFFRVRGFKTVVKVVDKQTGEISLYGNENIRPGFLWNTLAKKAKFSMSEKTYFFSFFTRKDKVFPIESWRALLESVPFFKHFFSMHITYHFRK